MGINTDLNIAPYFDDFDEAKQYNRILFKPAFAVQARELTQLQTILQNQVERFGSNVYKEGTVISGINLAERQDVYFVKLKDQANFANPVLYESSDEQKYFVVGQSSGLIAEILKAANGFETRAPNLKTFFVSYLNTTVSTETGDDIKQFSPGEILSVQDEDGTPITVTNSDGSISNLEVTVSTLEASTGKSLAISTAEGIIFQRGHFIFAEPQVVILSKYSTIASDVSVGFSIEENIITSAQDSSLLDNAQGYNNENAPGADRLQLVPVLSVYASSQEPEEFFALARYQNGFATLIRDVTEFNVIGTEMARRTYEESGNYVVRGMNVTLEQDETETYAVVSPGKAYVFGYEINSIANRYLPLDPSDLIQTKQNQVTGIEYEQYFDIDFADDDVVNTFVFDGTRYTMYDSGNQIVGYCSIRNITPNPSVSGKGRMHVYALDIISGNEIVRVENTPVTSGIKGSTKGAMLFSTGKSNLRTVENASIVRRVRESTVGGSTIIINGTADRNPIPNSNIYAVDSTNNLITLSSPPIYNAGTNQMTLNFSSNDAAFVYYDAVESGLVSDALEHVEVFVRSVVSNGIAYLGLPNVIKLLEIKDEDGDGDIVTSKFGLINNQKDGFYDISYLRLRTGETLTSTSICAKVVVLRRSSNYSSGYLSIDSYLNVDKNLIRPYTAKNGTTYDLLGSFDFRPYAIPQVAYATTVDSAEVATPPTELTLPAVYPIATSGYVSYDYEYYLSRIDAVCLDTNGTFTLVKGSPAENPSRLRINDAFPISEINIPGKDLVLTGPNRVTAKRVSTRNYTMEDIEKIDKQLSILTEQVSLSLLEQETNSLFIPDENGLNRFKNGILVEDFKNLEVADLSDPEYKAAIDRSLRILSPALKQFPIDLKKANINSNVNEGYSKVTTLADSELGSPISFITQPFATNFRNAVSNFYNYSGRAIIDPQFDSGYDVIQNPDINFTIDLSETLTDFVENLQEFVPLTSTDVRNLVNQTVTQEGRRITTTTRVNTTRRTDELVYNTVTGSTQEIGNFVTDSSFNPFMQEREVKILVTGLRPNTRHYFFFGETDVNQHVFPGDVNPVNGTLTVTDVSPTGQQGDIVRSDASGILAAVFVIPARTFYVGEIDLEISDVDQYGSIRSGGTSYSRVTYRAYDFNVSKQNLTTSTRTLDFDVNTTITTSQSVSSRTITLPPPPPPRRERDDRDRGDNNSCFVAGTIVTLANGIEKKIEDVEIGDKLAGQDGAINTVLEFDHPMLDGRDLWGFNESGPFMTPEHPVYTKEGWKAPLMSDTLVAYPHLESIMVGDLKVGDEILQLDGTWLKLESLECHIGLPDQRVYNFILDGNNTYYANGLLVHNRDPLSQTFFVKRNAAQKANSVHVTEIELFFKSKSETNGVTIEMREVVNGYPSSQIIPFGSKHLTPSEVNVSDNASVPTIVRFDNPLKCSIEKEYAFVIIPDAVDPNYTVFTQKVGERDLITGESITQDWGDGVLFTSTNNSAWQSYQDEDIKFTVRRANYTANTGYVDLVPNDQEFLTIENAVNNFRNDELVYAVKSLAVPVGLTDYTATVVNNTPGFAVNDYVLFEQGTNKFLAKILVASTQGSQTVLTLDTKSTLDTAAVQAINAKLVVAGRVTFFNNRRPDTLHLKVSSARTNNRFIVGDRVVGYRSGAYADVTSIKNEPLSFIQPIIYVDNGIRTNTTYELHDANGSTSIPQDRNVYLTNSLRTVPSKSNIVDPALSVGENFFIRVNMTNQGFTTVSPILDDDLSIINAYQYQITDDTDTSSAYVSKEFILQEEMTAVGLKVLLAAYRPVGTFIDVYARLVYTTNVEGTSDWIQLTNVSPGLFSSSSNIQDYRDYQYDLVEGEEFNSFQIKIVMRHAIDAELSNELQERGEHVFPHVYDYRAIALT
jgi:hypothetical protein